MFDDLKTYNGKNYSGMAVGSSHLWDYLNAVWEEKKVAPTEWEIRFAATKQRHIAAPEGSGAPVGTQYHWYILADQVVEKLDADRYSTRMTGAKFKLGHKRPHWRGFSYTYPDQRTYRQQLIKVLQETLDKLEQEEIEEFAQKGLNL